MLERFGLTKSQSKPVIVLVEPMTREQILAGLSHGKEDPAVKSVLAIVQGLRAMAVSRLADPGTPEDRAAQDRGRLAFASELEERIALCWMDIERTLKAADKREKAENQK